MTQDTELQTVREISSQTRDTEDRRIDGRKLVRKRVENDKLLNPQGGIAPNTITQAMMSANAIGKAEWKYETATLAFASGDTTKTASVTSGSIIIGVYSSVVTSTPAYGELQLGVASTTLTGTRSAACGGVATITYTITLLKV